MKRLAKNTSSEIRLFVSSFLPSLKLLRKNDPLRLAGATAFFTTFALPPIVFILAQIFGLILSPRTVGRGLIKNLGERTWALRVHNKSVVYSAASLVLVTAGR